MTKKKKRQSPLSALLMLFVMLTVVFTSVDYAQAASAAETADVTQNYDFHFTTKNVTLYTLPHPVESSYGGHGLVTVDWCEYPTSYRLMRPAGDGSINIVKNVIVTDVWISSAYPTKPYADVWHNFTYKPTGYVNDDGTLEIYGQQGEEYYLYAEPADFNYPSSYYHYGVWDT